MENKPIDFFRIYFGLNKHFCDDKYNFVEKQGFMKAINKRFEKEKAKKYFQIATTKYSVEQWKEYCMVNFFYKTDLHITNLLKPECQTRYERWVGWNMNRKENFIKDIDFVFSGDVLGKLVSEDKLKNKLKLFIRSFMLDISKSGYIGLDTTIYFYILFKKFFKPETIDICGNTFYNFFGLFWEKRYKQYLVICNISDDEKMIFKQIVKDKIQNYYKQNEKCGIIK